MEEQKQYVSWGALMLYMLMCFIDGGQKVCWLSRNTTCHIYVSPFLYVILLRVRFQTARPCGRNEVMKFCLPMFMFPF